VFVDGVEVTSPEELPPAKRQLNSKPPAPNSSMRVGLTLFVSHLPPFFCFHAQLLVYSRPLPVVINYLCQPSLVLCVVVRCSRTIVWMLIV
jgi:hypothetical protein